MKNALPTDVFEKLGEALRNSPPRGLVAAWLFGSHAEGRAHRESDVDVGILLDRRVHPTPRERFELRIELAGSLPAVIGGTAVDIVVLDDAPPGLGRHIVTTGRRIFCGDEALSHAFVRNVQLRAADLAPFLRRTEKRKLEALVR